MVPPVTHCLVIANTQGLPSAKRDVSTMLVLASLLRARKVLVVCNDASAGGKGRPGVAYSKNIDMVPRWLAECGAGDHVLISISSHGYQARSSDPKETDGMDEYFPFQGRRVYDNEVATWWSATEAHITCVVDTCHSGTMSDLDLVTLSSKIDTLRVVAVSACDDSQSSMDDIADMTGYGGGLVTKLSDHVHKHRTLMRTAFIEYARTALGQSQHAQRVVVTGCN